MPRVKEDQIRMWLQNSNYQNQPVTLREIINVLNQYRGLVPKCEPYVFNDGTCMDLLNLSGTIPVLYKSVTYNTPICIWLMNTHPYNAPICYVMPTPDMEIKISMYVDYNGKIYLPYLHDWVPHVSDIPGLIQVMMVTFGEYPPVFAKSTNEHRMPYMDFTKDHSYYGGYLAPAGTVNEHCIRLSLISAVEDKLKRRLREQFSQNQAELDTLRRIQQELQQGKVKLDEILQKLEIENVELEKNIKILKDKELELNLQIEKIQTDEFQIEDAITTTAPLYKQLLNAFAEEAATEDAIYYLDEALRRNVIDLDVFLKHVRLLSNKQFMLRALMQKCRQRAGLAG